MKRSRGGKPVHFGGVAGFGLALVLFAATTGAPAQAAPASQAGQSGEAIFQAKCAACHTIGRGQLVGPDLQGIASRQSHDWLVSWITEPDQLIARGDPIAQELIKQYPVQMPNMGVSPAEADAVLAYIAAAPAGGVGTAPAAVSLPPGDPVVGEAYFDGTRRFQNGGPPCIGCHSFGGIGALGGGVLGPDLGGAAAKFGDVGLASFLATVPTLTMNAVWSQAPLTPNEQADLAAFLKQPVAQRSTDALLPLTALTEAGTILLLVLAHLVWRRRLAGVRRPMVALRRLAPTSRRLASGPGR
ncbi:MAG: cytochrome c [Chloroflexi bacterium]|nr:cytochrome c [Chloroflexota bacterium]